jgi:hypothetical protein
MKRIGLSLLRLDAVIACGALLTVAAYAQEQTQGTAVHAQEQTQGTAVHVQEQTQDKDGWNVRVGIPFWAAGTHGTIGADNREVFLDESFIDALKALDFAAALNVEVRKGPWLFFSDGYYLKITDFGEPRGQFSGAQVELDQKLMFDDLAIGYAVVKNECFSLDLFAGAQLSYVAANLSLKLPVADRSASATDFWADPIVGAYLNYQFSNPAGFYAKADVGGFGVSSRLTWQVEGGFHFPIARNFYARLAYRTLFTDFERGALVFDATIRGPQVEFGVRF